MHEEWSLVKASTMVGTEAHASTSSPGPADAGGEEDKTDERMLECNICLDTARDAVVSMCGHLFWYACLYPLASISVSMREASLFS